MAPPPSASRTRCGGRPAAEAGLDPAQIDALHGAGAIGGPDGVLAGSFLS